MSQAKRIDVRGIMTAGHSVLDRGPQNDLPVAGVTRVLFRGRPPRRGGPGAK